jgi:hypothetical protein
MGPEGGVSLSHFSFENPVLGDSGADDDRQH